MLAEEMGMILTKHAGLLTARHWADFIGQLERRGLYIVIETDTNGKTMSPLGGLMPMPCKNETFGVWSAEELKARGLPIGHHVLNKPKEKPETVASERK